MNLKILFPFLASKNLLSTIVLIKDIKKGGKVYFNIVRIDVT